MNQINKIALIADYNPNSASHRATDDAIGHAVQKLKSKLIGEWISPVDIDPAQFGDYAGFWIAPGSPGEYMENTLKAIRYARENNLPCLGTCGGFQQMILEFARNVLGHHDAQHAEYNLHASNLFITPLDCSLFGKEMKIEFITGSKIASIYESSQAVENYYCKFGINPDVLHLFKRELLRVVGSDSEGEIRAVEIPGHRFYVGTLFVPQIRSTVTDPHPLVTAFIKSCLRFGKL